jgi:hypothetical protein
MLVQRKVGGNLSEVLDSISHTIRERVRILGEVRALTAEVRLSGNILTLLPVFTGLAISILSPGYLTPLFVTNPGRILLVIGSIVMLAPSFSSASSAQSRYKQCHLFCSPSLLVPFLSALPSSWSVLAIEAQSQPRVFVAALRYRTPTASAIWSKPNSRSRSMSV